MSIKNFESTIDTFIIEQSLPVSFKTHALTWFKPLLSSILSHQNSESAPSFIGLNGSQGSGKSTLCELLCNLINDTTEFSAVSISLDDFYLTKAARQNLGKNVHHLLETRGVPGTHDTSVIHGVLQKLKEGQACLIPRFDKSTDNPKPRDEWLQIDDKVDFVFFEGWCWGVEAQTASELVTPVNEMEVNKDAFGKWRSYVNDSLLNQYHTLYAFFDYWVMLKAPSFDCVYKWRCEQEHKLKATHPDGNGIMSDQQILTFIQHYQRLTEHCLQTLPEKCNTVFVLNEDRDITEKHTKNV